jgi:DNA-binding NarL/FixJ family response regulator
MAILLVDDDPAVTTGLREGFAEGGPCPELRVAASVVEALRDLRGDQDGRRAYAAVVVDSALLPGGPALALAELKAAAADAPVLVLISPKGRLERDGAMRAGAEAAFAKHPRAYPVLGRLLAEILERQALARRQLRLGAARADAELLLSAVMAADDAGLAILDAAGVVVIAKGGLARLAGRPLGGLLRRPVWPLLDEPGRRRSAPTSRPRPRRPGTARCAGSRWPSSTGRPGSAWRRPRAW